MGLLKKSGPTHADALQASRSVMKMALTRIAFYSEDEEARTIAGDALTEQAVVYKAGVYRAVD